MPPSPANQASILLLDDQCVKIRNMFEDDLEQAFTQIQGPDGKYYDENTPTIFISDAQHGDKFLLIPNGDMRELVKIARTGFNWSDGAEVAPLSDIMEFIDLANYEETPETVVMDTSQLLRFLATHKHPPTSNWEKMFNTPLSDQQ